MKIETNIEKRANRCRIEWLRVIRPLEYVVLDVMLFRANLTHANGGEGFKFHIRQLAKETGISAGKVSEICGKWPFIKKTGSTKGMLIQLDYPEFQKWIVHRTTNDCSSDEPRSSTKNSTVQGKIIHSVNNENPNKNEPSEARSEPQAIEVVKSEASPSQTDNPIVHPENNKKSAPYVANDEQPIPLPMPPTISPRPSIARQNEIMRQLNSGGFSFVKEGAIETERDGFKFCAVDEVEKIILITADTKGYLCNPRVQALCKHFRDLKYSIMLWTAQDQSIFKVTKVK